MKLPDNRKRNQFKGDGLLRTLPRNYSTPIINEGYHETTKTKDGIVRQFGEVHRYIQSTMSPYEEESNDSAVTRKR